MYGVIAYLLLILYSLKHAEKPNHTGNRTKKTDNKGNTSPMIARAEPPIPPPIDKQPPTQKRKKKWRKILRDWAQVIGVIVLTIYTATTIGLWYAAKEANNQAYRNSHLEQRAWVGVKGYFLPVKVEPNVSLEAKYLQVNFGHGPAFFVGNRVGFGVLENKITEKIADDQLNKTKLPNRYTLLPNGEMPAGNTSVTINDYWLSKVNTGKAWLYYFGDISYKDSFGEMRRTTFCSVYLPTTKEFAYCDTFNDAN